MKVYIIYLNDIFIYNRIKKKHDFHIKTILYAFNKIEMILNLEKCKFFQKSNLYGRRRRIWMETHMKN